MLHLEKFPKILSLSEEHLKAKTIPNQKNIKHEEINGCF